MIHTTSELKRLCERLHKQKFITVDTEFIRERTFYPQLCLIQVGSEKGAWVIDALAKNLDLSPFFDLLSDKSVIKVFHACRQDIEIFYHLMHVMPQPVFDTQIGAMVCGYPENIGYQRLVEDYLGIKLDKGMRVTDWSHRPLSKEQQEYALHDVIELAKVYTKMMEDICKNNRLDWIQEEIQTLLDPLVYEPDASRLMAKMRLPFSNPEKIHLCARLCEWREEWAKKMNLPRQFIMSDNSLIECAAIKAEKEEDFNRLRSLSKGFLENEIGLSLREFCRHVAKEKVKDWPVKQHCILSPGKKSQFEALRLLLNIVCEEVNVAPYLVATSEEITQYLIKPGTVRFMTGWRHQIFGKKVQDLLAGKIAFFYDPQKQSLVVRSV